MKFELKGLSKHKNEDDNCELSVFKVEAKSTTSYGWKAEAAPFHLTASHGTIGPRPLFVGRKLQTVPSTLQSTSQDPLHPNYFHIIMVTYTLTDNN